MIDKISAHPARSVCSTRQTRLTSTSLSSTRQEPMAGAAAAAAAATGPAAAPRPRPPSPVIAEGSLSERSRAVAARSFPVVSVLVCGSMETELVLCWARLLCARRAAPRRDASSPRSVVALAAPHIHAPHHPPNLHPNERCEKDLFEGASADFAFGVAATQGRRAGMVGVGGVETAASVDAALLAACARSNRNAILNLDLSLTRTHTRTHSRVHRALCSSRPGGRARRRPRRADCRRADRRSWPQHHHHHCRDRRVEALLAGWLAPRPPNGAVRRL